MSKFSVLFLVISNKCVILQRKRNEGTPMGPLKNKVKQQKDKLYERKRSETAGAADRADP
jgi:hypothetical protein